MNKNKISAYSLIMAASRGGGGGGSAPVIQSKTITENGIYRVPAGVDGFNPVVVDVPEPNLTVLNIYKNGRYYPPEGFTGFNVVSAVVEAEANVNFNYSTDLLEMGALKSISGIGTARVYIHDFGSGSDSYVPEGAFDGSSFEHLVIDGNEYGIQDRAFSYMNDLKSLYLEQYGMSFGSDIRPSSGFLTEMYSSNFKYIAFDGMFFDSQGLMDWDVNPFARESYHESNPLFVVCNCYMPPSLDMTGQYLENNYIYNYTNNGYITSSTTVPSMSGLIFVFPDDVISEMQMDESSPWNEYRIVKMSFSELKNRETDIPETFSFID